MKKVKKIKNQYLYGEKTVLHNGKEYINYPNLKNHNRKHFSTLQERSFAAMHEVEYSREYRLNVRSKRGSSLPNDRDDLRSSARSLASSWKHNSKRKNQYFK